MAEWKKILVSGSNIEVNQITGSTAIFSGDVDIDGVLSLGNIADVSSSLASAIAGTAAAGDGIFVNGNVVSVDSGSLVGDGLATGAGKFAVKSDSATGGDVVGVSVGANGVGLDISGLAGNGLGTNGNGALEVGAPANSGLNVAASSISVNSGSMLPYYSGSIFGTVSGDITITAGGVASIAADSVALGTDTTGNYVATIANATNGGTSITNGSGEGSATTIALNIEDLADGAVDVANHNIAIDAGGTTVKESIVDLVAGITGTNLTATAGVISLSDNVTIAGNLTVQGDTINANVTNLDIEDRYILLNSGSSTVGDSGIIFGGSTGTAQSGSAIIWDGSYNTNDGRLAVVNSMGSTDTGNQTPDYYVAGVYIGDEASAATAQADHQGNIRIDGTEIFIYV